MKKNQHRLLLGAHISIAGGFHKALERGASIGCTAIQIFTKSNRQWTAKKISEEEAVLFRDSFRQSSIAYVVAHATYLINLGSPDSSTAKKSVQALTDELDRCNMLDIPYLVLHPGSRVDSDEKECIQRIADNLNEAMSKTTSKTLVLLETMAGQGSTIGNTFEQLALLRSKSEFQTKVGVCLDTCHVFAAGYDFRTPDAYKKMWKTFDEIIGLNHLKAIHLNDSKKEFNSRTDRHEDIGKGQLGLESFRLIINDKNLFDVPKILETPKEDDLVDDLRNLKEVKKLLEPATRKTLGFEEE